ncbi:histidine phosphatase family protein [Micromonospora sp. NPDC050187]|uniref:histidine phosphatase family protein n=1 Tax=Micromonospora sp. NPDC050187 TaxID=3364277 RepID=UPI0037979113
MTRLIVWRHGNTDWNNARRVQGQTDVPLNERGREQALAAAPLLAALRPDAIVSSDLSRAADTATALAALTGLPVHTDPRLRERHFGQWQGLLIDEVTRRFPAEYARWRSGDPDPGAGLESLDDLGKRVGTGFQAAVDAVLGGTVVVATHGGGARQGCGHLLGWGQDVLATVISLANCHWTELRHDEVRGWQLRAHNVGAPAVGVPAGAGSAGPGFSASTEAV